MRPIPGRQRRKRTSTLLLERDDLFNLLRAYLKQKKLRVKVPPKRIVNAFMRKVLKEKEPLPWPLKVEEYWPDLFMRWDGEGDPLEEKKS